MNINFFLWEKFHPKRVPSSSPVNFFPLHQQPVSVWLTLQHAGLVFLCCVCLACLSTWSPEPDESPPSDLLQPTFIRGVIQSDNWSGALSPCTQPTAIQPPPGCTLPATRVKGLLIARLQKASSVLTERGRAMERLLWQGESICEYLCVCVCVFMYKNLLCASIPRLLPVTLTGVIQWVNCRSLERKTAGALLAERF